MLRDETREFPLNEILLKANEKATGATGYARIPFMLLNSLEAIDAEQLATLINYLNDYTGI